MRLLLCMLVLVLAVPGWSLARQFHVDPIHGSMQNDGSASAPWATLQEVVEAGLISSFEFAPLPYDPATSSLVAKNAGAPVQGGDTLVLHAGLHGSLLLRGYRNAREIVVMAADGEEAILGSMHLLACSRWKFLGVRVSTEPYGAYDGGNLVYLESHGYAGPTAHITLDNCDVYSAEQPWDTAEEWLDKVSSGIFVRCDSSLVTGCTVRNTDMGVMVMGDANIIRGTEVVNFSGDGMRILGSWNLFEANIIRNCYDVDDNHDDGIQSYTTGGLTVDHNIVRRNIILNYTDPDQPLRGPLQGIGCFDGFYNDWVVENNLIVVDHWHGITFMGARNCRIINNTVLDPTPGVRPGPSWIQITDTKGGEKSSGCLVKNNVSNQFVVEDLPNPNAVLRNISEYDLNFRNAATLDFHLLPNSVLIDGADGIVAPPDDLDGNPRPTNGAPDIGCYEFQANTDVDELPQVSNLELYPNPARDVVHILSSNREAMTYQIFDQLGRCVMQGGLSRGTPQLTVSHLRSGLYLILLGEQHLPFVVLK
ncbi:right-handed parallel beta-helix repeat-containing protein [bacterium]|nr:right-handed parallel beta-helix repeat-containing protein [bacterium]